MWHAVLFSMNSSEKEQMTSNLKNKLKYLYVTACRVKSIFNALRIAFKGELEENREALNTAVYSLLINFLSLKTV